MNTTIANRKKAAHKIEKSMPAGSRIDYHTTGHDNILSAFLPAVGSYGPHACEEIKNAVSEIGDWDSVEDASMDRDLSTSYTICIVFK